jgi:hypothetical protein
VVYTTTVDTFMTTPTMFAFPADKVDTVTLAPGVGDGVFVLDDLTYSTIPVVDAGVNIEVSSEEQNTVIIQGTASDEDGGVFGLPVARRTERAFQLAGCRAEW